ncbi:M61 family metallopeptidase [Aquincola sp. S2]|uniref:M61 family metallopeptidase n=1 Tax=Pseudaquabacterium terrae TaxID=2732868 RepID=A0ABX2EQG4_9BURK|nr:M61 family metallopeptidase [Aquabacterium terrae]NRF70853.1 M61 family metallopeptidase [Aquabacterium terrae]
MPAPLLRLITIAGLALALHTTPATAQDSVRDEPYPGLLRIEVDATDLDHRVFRVRQRLPVKPGPLKLFFARWLPGTHGPSGDVTRLSGLTLQAAGQPLAWTRDPLDGHAFLVTVPEGADELVLEFAYLSSVSDQGRVVATRQMLNLQWNNLLLYPAGHPARRISVQASMVLPPGWQHGSALRAEHSSELAEGSAVRFQPVSLETLVDSPVFAGRHLRRFELDAPGSKRPVALHLLADQPEQLKASEAQIDAHRRLVQQADRLFGARHFAKYDFLLALSDELGRIGLEHHESSENAVGPKYFEAWDKSAGSRALLPHEYVHSWNGKYRRPADLLTPHYNVPMQNSLLWLYEGQTEFWGRVLAARSGLVNAELTRDGLAQTAAMLERRSGRGWRSLQDTTNDNVMGRSHREWQSMQRTSSDYYHESVFVWLEADALIRDATAGRRSLDDFARNFFGGDDGRIEPKPYRFDDVVAALNAVHAQDWARWLRERLDGHRTGTPAEALARAGWRLVFSDVPSENFKAGESNGKHVDLNDSLGLRIGAEGKLDEVVWDSPAYRAGLSPAARLVAVNMRAYGADELKQAITANRQGEAPIELLVREGALFRQVRIDWRGGLRYPKLERIAGREDRLGALLAPR